MSLTRLETEHLIALCRAYRDTLRERKLELTERERAGGNDHAREALLACENELHLLQGITAKLWNAMLAMDKPPKP